MSEIAKIKEKLAQMGLETQVFESKLKWDELNLNSDAMIPVIVQDHEDGTVLMLAYMNQEAYEITMATGIVTYYSRSRQEIWVKGLTSGHFQYLKEIAIDCDNDTILVKVDQVGAACHTGNRTCFYRTLATKENID